MGFGRQNLQASNTGNGPYAANYNRSYDTHTEKGSNTAFAVNPPAYSDTGPYEYSGIGPDPIERRYVMPNHTAPDQAFHGSPQYGYIGDTIGPREIQTGNAPSGGYSTLPGNGFAAGFQKNAIPDNRRIKAKTRGDDWEENQVAIHAQRDAELRYRRGLNVDEDWVYFDSTSGVKYGPSVNAVEDSPYRKDWPDGHAQRGMAGGSATYHTNPNKFRNFDVFDSNTSYRTTGARFLNGTHYSMAVHPSLTPYSQQAVGGTPVRSLRNTYGLVPQPWDATNTDSPANTAGYATNVTANGMNGSLAYGSSYRLS